MHHAVMMMTYCFLCLKKYNQKTKETFSLFNWTTRDLWRYEYMAGAYYKPCKEFDICNELIEKYWETKQYDKCFEGHLVLAEQGYPLAECQIGYFYYEGLGVEKDLEKALYWTRRAAEHGDRDGQYNLAEFYEDAIGVERDIEQAM